VGKARSGSEEADEEITVEGVTGPNEQTGQRLPRAETGVFWQLDLRRVLTLGFTGTIMPSQSSWTGRRQIPIWW